MRPESDPRPDPDALLRKLQQADSTRGRLRIYLGAAPGVGKTYAMLNEGRRRKGRGTDVVVAFAETYDRPLTVEALEGLEMVPRRQVAYQGVVLEEMDTAAVIARHPQVALVDELAHTNAPGSTHEKRWQDIEEIRDAGITVISTLNIQHLEGLKDVVAGITGVQVRETVPDHVVDGADELWWLCCVDIDRHERCDAEQHAGKRDETFVIESAGRVRKPGSLHRSCGSRRAPTKSRQLSRTFRRQPLGEYRKFV